MKNRRLLYGFVILLLILLVQFMTNIVRGYYCYDSYLLGVLRVAYLFAFWIILLILYFKNIESLSQPFKIILLFLFPFFCSMVVINGATSKSISHRIESEKKKDQGYYVLQAKKRAFVILGCVGWPYDIFVNDYKLYLRGTSWLPNSSDTILVGVLKEGKPSMHFIFNEHPTHQEIEHAQMGWYMEGDTEKPFNESEFQLFKKEVLRNDSIAKENGKLRNKYSRNRRK